MGQIGFGAVSGSRGVYSAMYAFDRSNSTGKQNGVVWPAQTMPIEFFDSSYPWSYSSGKSENINNISVTLTRKKDGKTWTFSSSSADGYFNVNNAGYGQSGCVIFFPENMDAYQSGDLFRVTITGLVSGTAEYDVEFFSFSDKVVDETKIRQFVTRLYQVCLDREPDEGGLDSWTSELINGTRTGSSTAYGFIFSDEFKKKNYCNEHYLRQLYKAFMDREADDAGLSYWLEAMSTGMNREAVFNGFCQSLEFSSICEEYGIVLGSPIASPQYGTIPKGPCSICKKEDGVTGFVKRLYQVCLDREADEAGLDYWTNALWNHEASGSLCAVGFIFSPEFVEKNYRDETYVEYLYRALMGREADESGKAYWVEQLQSGSSRKDAFDGFVYSPEFNTICQSYGIIR